MNSEKIYDAITNIRDDFITEAKESKPKRIYFRTLLMAAVLVALASGTVLAVWLLRSPSGVVGQSPKLSEILGCEDVALIDEAVDIGNYRVTLLGMAPGNSLAALDISETQPDTTYVITAVQKLDGSDMPAFGSDEYTEHPFYTLAFVKGVPPWQYMATTSAEAVILDGIQFMLICCDDLEPFADKGVYLIVSHETFYSNNAYHYDLDTGECSPNEGYDGVNAIFNLPLDPSKADPALAEAMLDAIREPVSSGMSSSVERSETIDIDEDGAFQIPPSDDFRARAMLGFALCGYYRERPLEEFTLMEDLVKECPVVDGFIQYEYEIEYEGGTESSRGNVPFHPDEFIDGYYTSGMSPRWERDREGYYTIRREVFYLDGDSVVWLMLYTVTSNEIPREAIDDYNQRLLDME